MVWQPFICHYTGLTLCGLTWESSANSTVKTWSLSLSPLTPGHGLAQCYMHSLPPPTIHAKNLGAPHTLTPNITDPTPTSCTNGPPNHHAHSGSSNLSTSDGCNLHHQHDGRYLATPTLHPHQVYILSNSLDSAYLRHTAHYYEMLPVCSNFITQDLTRCQTLTGKINCRYNSNILFPRNN